MKKFITEFKQFAMKGNVLDLAVGVIIGAAFKSIVDSLVNDILSPVLGLLVKSNFSDLSFNIGEVKIAYGAFVTSVINFLFMALVLFIIVKTINKLNNIGKKPAAEAPKTKACPYCKKEIDIDAVKCPYCTSDVTDNA